MLVCHRVRVHELLAGSRITVVEYTSADSTHKVLHMLILKTPWFASILGAYILSGPVKDYLIEPSELVLPAWSSKFAALPAPPFLLLPYLPLLPSSPLSYLPFWRHSNPPTLLLLPLLCLYLSSPLAALTCLSHVQVKPLPFPMSR